VITSGNLETIPDGLCGIRTGQKEIEFSENAQVSIGEKRVTEKCGFKAGVLIASSDSKPLASSNNIPLALELEEGNGTLTVLASQFGINSKQDNINNPGVDNNMKSPFPLLSHVELIIGDILKSTCIFNPIDGLSLITCRKNAGEYTVAICNNTWDEKPFEITPSHGKILTISELPTDGSERKATGFMPESVKQDPGVNSRRKIAGGDIRIFNVRIGDEKIEEMPFIMPVPNPVNRGLPLRNITSVKREMLLRPTFFQHFDRITIDWRYLTKKEKSALSEEAVWIKNQGLKIIVDLSSGINLFPDLRIVNNDSAEYRKSMDLIGSLIEKMDLFGAGDLIMTAHRAIENNFTDEDFAASLKNTLRSICMMAAGKGINVHLRLVPGKYYISPVHAKDFLQSVDQPNFYLAPSLAMLAADPGNLKENFEIFKELKYSILFIGAPEKDIYGKLWNLNLPLYKYGHNEDLKSVLHASKDKILLLDGIYVDKDEEYLDNKNLEELITEIL
jgi:hypothetical protein